MKKTFTASRIGGESVVFPARVVCEDSMITLKIPGFFNNRASKFFYSDITQVSKDCPLVGWSTIYFTVNSVRVEGKGFTKGDVESIEEIIMLAKSGANQSGGGNGGTILFDKKTQRELEKIEIEKARDIAKQEKIKAETEETRLANEAKRLELEERRLEQEERRNIATETSEQRNARVAEEERLEAKRSEIQREENKRERYENLYSKDISESLKEPLRAIVEENLSDYNDKASVTKRLRSVTRTLDRFLNNNDTRNKWNISQEFRLAVERFETLIDMLEEIDANSPQIDIMRERAVVYYDDLKRVETSVKKADDEWYKNYQAKERSKKIGCWGAVIVVIGVVVLKNALDLPFSVRTLLSFVASIAFCFGVYNIWRG